MEPDRKCPLCGEEFLLMEQAAVHVAIRHLAQVAWGNFVDCWCLERFVFRRDRYQAQSSFATHLGRYGGPSSHWLAVQLVGPLEALGESYQLKKGAKS